MASPPPAANTGSGVGRAGGGAERNVSDLGQVSVEGLLDIPVDMTSRQLGRWIWSSEEGSGPGDFVVKTVLGWEVVEKELPIIFFHS